MLAEAEREILTQAITLAKAIKRKPRAGWGYPGLHCAKNSSSLACIQAPATPPRKRTVERISLVNFGAFAFVFTKLGHSRSALLPSGASA
jgi:hypothetical protein